MNKVSFGNCSLKPLVMIYIALMVVPAHAEGIVESTLCKAEEAVIFNCLHKKKVASLCASSGLSKESGQIRYRFGTTGRVELEYPGYEKGSRELFWFSSTGYSGGSESHIRFVNGRFTYLLYEKMIRTGFPGEPSNPDGVNKPEMSGGIIVHKNGSNAIRLVCRNNVSISSIAYQSLEKEEFQDAP